MIGCGGSGSNTGRANRRGDSTGPVADRTPARAGSHWAAFPDVATGIPSRRENLSDRRADLAGKPGPLALSGADPTGTRAAIPARADSAVEINKDSSEADADIEMTRRKA